MKPAFVSDDGRVFDTEEACINHERFLENKYDALTGMIRDGLLQVEKNRDLDGYQDDASMPVGVVAELIFTTLDIVKKSGIELTRKGSKRELENRRALGDYREHVSSAKIETLINNLHDFFEFYYLDSYIELESSDDAEKLTERFHDFFYELAKGDLNQYHYDCSRGRCHQYSKGEY